MPSISFDAVAHRYDASRGYPEEVAQQLAEVIDQAAGGNTKTRFLEVGVGTGRIAVPLAERGRHYTGIDISVKMQDLLVEKLRTADWREEPLPWGCMPDENATQNLDVQHFVHDEKQGAMRLVVADMTDIPFHNQSFDVVIATHVFHLVSEWQQALQEVLRVLRPGGVFVRCWGENWEELWKPGSGDIRQQWCAIVQELGGNTTHPGASDQAVTEWLQAAGLQTEQWGGLSFRQEIRPRTILEEIEQRLWTSARLVPDHIFTASLERLRQWADEHYGATIDDRYIQQHHVVISRTQV